MGSIVAGLGIRHSMLAEAARDAAEHSVRPADAAITGVQSSRLRSLHDERAAEFQRRLEELALEFGSIETGGTSRYGLVVGIFATDHPAVAEAST